MDVHLIEIEFGETVVFGVGAGVGEGCLSGLLHHIPQLPGQDQSPFAGHDDDLDLHQITAGLGPGQTGGNANLIFGFDLILQETLWPQVPSHTVRRNAPPRFFAFGDAPRHFATDRRQFTLQVTHTCFVSVILDDFVDRFFAKLKADFFETVLPEQTRNDESPRNQNLLEISVAREFDHFHAVEQRQRDAVGVVGCGNEEHIAEIVRNFQIMIAEGIVLFRIEHFQQG